MLLYGSCKKDAVMTSDHDKPLTVEEAKIWLKVNKPDLDLENNWDNPVILEGQNGKETLKIRLNEKLYEHKTWVLRDVIFQRDSLNQIQAYGYKVFVNDSYFSNKDGANQTSADKRTFINEDDFTGKVVIYTLDNHAIRGWRYINGKVQSDLIVEIIRGSNQNPVAIKPNQKADCDGKGLRDDTPCSGGGGDSPTPFDGGENGHPLKEVPITAPAPRPGWTPSNNPTGPIPIGNPNSGPLSGGGGNSNSPDIINSIKDPCLKKALDKAKSSDVKGAMEKIIKELDGNAKVKIDISDKSELLTSTGEVSDGKATAYSYSNGTFSCSIILNQGILSNSTQEYIISTIIHETIHAYLQYQAGNTDNHSSNHEVMANKYVSIMSGYLVSIFPKLNAKDANALSWGGLQGTSLWSDSKKNDSFTYGNGQSMTYNEMSGLGTAYRNGYAENSTKPCGN